MEWARDTAQQTPWALKFARNYAQMDRSQTRFVAKEVSKPMELVNLGRSLMKRKKKECDLLGCNCSEGCRK